MWYKWRERYNLNRRSSSKVCERMKSLWAGMRIFFVVGKPRAAPDRVAVRRVNGQISGAAP